MTYLYIVIRTGRLVTGTRLSHRFDTELVARIRSKLPADSSEKRNLSADLQCELWAVSAQNQLEIVRKLEAGLRNDLAGAFKYVIDWQQGTRGMAKKNTPIFIAGATTTQLPTSSNTKFYNSQKWSIDRARFGRSAAIEFAAVSAAGRGMCIRAN
ncbi:hypothetical protein GGR51DRAFT_556943 [Nemania sp. FL0031]|nr:hypothetical protein GGR51DRAFT_556943 [Nemania sp. FL0031]